MLVSLILTYTCDCGATATGVMVKQLRINKLSMRTLGQGLGMMPRTCEAGHPLADDLPVTYRLHDDDMTRINAYRQRKGWPLLVAEDAARQAASTWKPAGPSDTPGELVPEHGPTQPVDLRSAAATGADRC
ncbi:hypothetical protein [Micromonospora sp. 4G55]|uniref:hypothetical protein n=1 Tax=Micromonospora sp. 4G55 TaxID=2806102 RepID=UPI001A58D10A|nr:hypothetical protein [Micromonospora sp. 4G55]MBM0257362.1 hypothetical protein [Micromonospora sp. 4G55]